MRENNRLSRTVAEILLERASSDEAGRDGEREKGRERRGKRKREKKKKTLDEIEFFAIKKDETERKKKKPERDACAPRRVLSRKMDCIAPRGVEDEAKGTIFAW